MKTRYRVGQRVWYVDTCAYPVGQSKAVCYYRPIRGTIGQVKIKQHEWFRGRRHIHSTVNYLVYFDVKERNRGHHQNSENIFANKANAFEWARLINELCNSRKWFKTEEERVPTAKRILNQMKEHRKKEPIEESDFLD
jgi:hypothetical protein